MIQKIKEEIERQIEEGKAKCQQSQENNDYESFVAWSEHVATCGKLLVFINSLTEEPKCIYNRTLEERIKSCKYCSAACNVRIKEESASEDLEEEILNQWEDYPHTLWSKCPYIDFKNIAHHFAEWQRQKDQEIVKLTESQDLDEASWKYSDRDGIGYGQRYAMQIDFKAGAEWQKQQDEELFKDDSWNYIEEHYPNITKEEKLRLYDISIKSRLAGANAIKQKMMKNAVETTIVDDWQYGKDPVNVIFPAIHQRIDGFDVNDKVKIIIIKEEQQ